MALMIILFYPCSGFFYFSRFGFLELRVFFTLSRVHVPDFFFLFAISIYREIFHGSIWRDFKHDFEVFSKKVVKVWCKN